MPSQISELTNRLHSQYDHSPLYHVSGQIHPKFSTHPYTFKNTLEADLSGSSSPKNVLPEHSHSTYSLSNMISKNRFYLPPSIESSLENQTNLDTHTPIPIEANTPNSQNYGRDKHRNTKSCSRVNFTSQSKDDSILNDPILNLHQNDPSPANNDLHLLKDMNKKFVNNPSIGYLNINSLRGNKMLQLNEMLKGNRIDILCIDETKLSPEIPTSRVHINGYQFPPHRRDRPQKSSNSFAGGKIVYIKDGLITKRLTDFETITAETICIEFSLKTKKWFIMFGYRPESIDRNIFFQEVNLALSKAMNKYENIIFIGDLNIDLDIPNSDKENQLGNLCDVFNLSNLIKDKTCYMTPQGTSIDVILTNKPRSFYKSIPIETGLSDHHKLVITFLRSKVSYKLKAKNVIYRETNKIDTETSMGAINPDP